MIFETVNQLILKKICKLTGRIDSKVKDLIGFVCLAAICTIFSLAPRSIYDGRRMAVISIIVLILIAAFSDENLKPVRWNLCTALSIELFALSMIIIRPIHPVGQGYVIFALDILFIFPMLYTELLNRENQAWLFDLLSYAVIITGIVCFVLGIILAQGSNGSYVFYGRVAGATKNPNYYGMVGLALVMSGAYNIARENDNLLWNLITAVSTGIGVSVVIASVSRTAMLSSMGCAAALIIFMTRDTMQRSAESEGPWHPDRKRLLMSAAAVLLIIITAAASLKLQQAVFFCARSEDSTDGSFLPQVRLLTEVYAEDEREAAAEEVPDDEQASIKDRISTDTDIDTFSSGRISLWKMYSEHLNIAGNDYEAEISSGAFTGMRESRAHNNIIDYAYRFGIPAGMLYLVFYIAILVKSIAIVFRKKPFTAVDMWIVMVAGAYALYAMVEISTLPFTRYIPCLFFLSIAPLMGEPPEKEETE